MRVGRGMSRHDPFQFLLAADAKRRKYEAALAAQRETGAEAGASPIGRVIEVLYADYAPRSPAPLGAWRLVGVFKDGGRREAWALTNEEPKWQAAEELARNLLPDADGSGEALARGRQLDPVAGRLALYGLERMFADNPPTHGGELIAWKLTVWSRVEVDSEVWCQTTVEPRGEWPPRAEVSMAP